MIKKFFLYLFRDYGLIILPLLWTYMIVQSTNDYLAFKVLKFILLCFQLISIAYFMSYIAKRLKIGYKDMKLIFSIILAIINLCLVNSAYYLCYQRLDSESFSNVPANCVDAILEFIWFSIGNMFYNNITQIQPMNTFTKLLIHSQMIISFTILVLFLSFIKDDSSVKDDTEIG